MYLINTLIGNLKFLKRFFYNFKKKFVSWNTGSKGPLEVSRLLQVPVSYYTRKPVSGTRSVIKKVYHPT